MVKPTSNAMHVAKVVSRRGEREYVSYLVRRSYRDGPKVKHRTLANLSALPEPIVTLVRRGLAGDQFIAAQEAFTIASSRPHGHASAVLGTARKLGLDADKIHLAGSDAHGRVVLVSPEGAPQNFEGYVSR